MAQTIGPLVKGRSWIAGIMAYVGMASAMVIAAVGFGLLVGGGASLLGMGVIPIAWRLSVLVAFAVMWIPHELAWIRLPMIQRRRQVPVVWRSAFGPVLGSAAYGAVLGVGLLTFVGHSGLYVVTLGVLLVAAPWAGMMIFGAYALGRIASITIGVACEFQSVHWYVRVLGWSQQLGVMQATAIATIVPMVWLQLR